MRDTKANTISLTFNVSGIWMIRKSLQTHKCMSELIYAIHVALTLSSLDICSICKIPVNSMKILLPLIASFYWSYP